MQTKWIAAAVALMTGATAQAPLIAETANFRVRATVPVICNINHVAAAPTPAGGEAYALGRISEFCNSPRGYEVLVDYTPGTLRGAIISVGEDRVTLTGSGQAVLSRANGPRIRERPLMATPGEAGFDSGNLRFRMQPA